VDGDVKFIFYDFDRLSGDVRVDLHTLSWWMM